MIAHGGALIDLARTDLAGPKTWLLAGDARPGVYWKVDAVRRRDSELLSTLPTL